MYLHCSIFVPDFIKITRNLQELQLFSSIYHSEESVKFQMLWILQYWGITPLNLIPQF